MSLLRVCFGVNGHRLDQLGRKVSGVPEGFGPAGGAGRAEPQPRTLLYCVWITLPSNCQFVPSNCIICMSWIG
jgi:hypothetical protein